MRGRLPKTGSQFAQALVRKPPAGRNGNRIGLLASTDRVYLFDESHVISFDELACSSFAAFY